MSPSSSTLRSRPAVPRAAVSVLGVALALVACSSGESGDGFCDAAQTYQAALESSTSSATREEAAQSFSEAAETMRAATAPDQLTSDWEQMITTASGVASALSGDSLGAETKLLLDADYRQSVAAVRDYVETSCAG